MDFHGQHHWASASRLLMTAFNLCRGPVSGSQSVYMCICECVCLYKAHSLQTQRASASFSSGCLCVTSPVNPVGQSFYTAALSTLHFPTQHAAKPCAPVHSTKLPCASAQRQRRRMTLSSTRGMHTCRISTYTHPRIHTNKQKYTHGAGRLSDQ